MFSVLVVFIIMYLVAIKNSECALMGTNESNSYIKNQWKITKELLDTSYSLLHMHNNKNITVATKENFNKIIGEESQKEFWNKNLDASTLLNFKNETIFIKCVRKLVKLLDYRLKVNIEKNNNWLSLRRLYLDKGKIDLASFEVTEDTAVSLIVNPVQLKNLSILSLMDIAAKEAVPEKYIFFENEKGHYLLSGAIVLNGLVNFQKISISNLSTTYLMDKKVGQLLISEIDQTFSTDLRNLRNLIRNLQVNSICGLPFKYWLRNHDRSETDLNNINLNSCSIYNDTGVISIARVNSTYRIKEINVNQINGIDIKNVVNSSFLLRGTQVIRGDLISVNPLRVVELLVERLNNVSSSRLLNKVKNESVDEISVDRLEVYHLLVDKINEVTVNDAARISGENVIKGKVKISNLSIRNQVKVKENVAVPLYNSMQVYEEVLIVGNIFVKNVQLESENCVTITFDPEENNRNEIKQVSSNQVLEQSWRKSEDQVISQNVRFEKGATINELDCQYLNGLREHEFVYSTCNSLLQMGNVTFNHVHLIEQLQLFVSDNRSEGSSLALEGFFKKFSSDFIVFDKLISFTRLSMDRLVLDSYNGIPVNDIMHSTSNDSFQTDFPSDFKIRVFRATEQMNVRQLSINWLNVRSASTFAKAVRSDKTLKVGKLGGEKLGKREINAIRMNNVKIKDLCGKNVEGGLLKQEILIKSSRGKIALTIAERLDVENSLNIINRSLNEEDLDYYINNMKRLHLDNVIETKRIQRIKRMDVFNHLNAHHLLMEKLQDVFAEALSISSQQVVPRKLMAEHVKIDYLSSEKLNKIKTSCLMHTDTPRRINGSKYFSSLVVEGNVKTTKGLNHESAAMKMVIAEQLKISGAMLKNQSVHVFGFLFWEDGRYSSSSRSESVRELFSYAVSKSNDQSIDCSLVVEQATAIDSLEIADKNSSLVLNKILETLSESLIDRDECLECDDSTTTSTVSAVAGKKVLKKKVTAHDVKVLKDIKTQSIDHVHFDKMILQLFRKSEESENKMTLAKLSFLYELEIESLRTQSSNRESISTHNFALTDEKIMPSRLVFKRLIIERNVSLYELDNLVFNEFIKKRVNTALSYNIFADVQFNRSITVLTSSSIVVLNGITDKHFIFQYIKAPAVPALAAATLIKGKKNFSSILRIENNLDVTSLSDQTSDFNMFVNVDYNTEIFGNLEIEEDVKSLSDILLLGQLNNTEVLRGEPSEPNTEKLRKILISKANAMDQLAAAGATNKHKLSGRFFYLERINTFNLQWLTGVQAVTSTSIDYSSTRLDLYVSEAGTFCGSSSDCPCRAHLLLEISSSGNHRVVQAKSANVLFNFFEPRALFGLRVLSEAGVSGESDEAVRSGKDCSRHEAAAATIFWTKLNASGEAMIEKLAVRIEGFIAHAQVFLINNDKLYMILAKFYDNTLQSYATDSLVYEFDLESKKVNKRQSIATEGAKTVHIFQVAKTGVYALIGCVKGKAESPLLRFDPITRQFQLIRTFATGGSKHIASLSTENKSFVILSNPDIEALQIYIYNVAFDNFYDYQNVYFQSRVSSLNVFYSEDFGQSKAYFTVTTKHGLFYIYQYTFSGKFKMKISYRIEDFQVLSPFRIGNQNYLFATHRLNSTIFKVVQDSN